MASDEIILGGILWAVVGLGIAVAAALCGRPFLPWLLYGIAYWPLALFHLLVRKHRVRDAGPIEEAQGA